MHSTCMNTATQLAYSAVQSMIMHHIRVAIPIPHHAAVCYSDMLLAALQRQVTT